MIKNSDRKNAFIILFQLDLRDFNADIDELIRLNLANSDMTVSKCTQEIISGVVNEKEKIDAVLQKSLVDWDVKDLMASDRTALRIAYFEITHMSVPRESAVQGAKKLAMHFSGDKSPAFVSNVIRRMTE